MAFVIYAFSVEDQQDLGRFVSDAEISCDLIGYGPVVYQVEVVKIDGIRDPGSFQPALTMALVEQRVLCLKMTCGRPADLSRISVSWFSV